MVTPERATKIRVDQDLGTLLMFRRTVAPLFRKISKSKTRRLVLDFSGVEFMSRSFADEYLAAKRASGKRIEERNVPREVRRMLQVVSRRPMGGASQELWSTSAPPEPYEIVP